MRVLQTYAGNLYGGIERLLVSLALASDQCARFGIENQFALCFRGRLSQELEQTGIDPFELGAVRFSRPWTVLAARRRLSQLIASKQLDMVITHASWMHAVLGPAVRRCGIPLVNWVHDTLCVRVLQDRLAAMSPPDLVLANSRHSSLAAASVFPRTRAEIIHYPLTPPSLGLAVNDRCSTRAALACPENAVVVLQVSRLERWKGQTVLLDSLAAIKDRTDWVCWIAGGPQRTMEQTYFSELHAQANRLGIAERVKFLGQRSDIAQLMRAADIFCQPNTGPEPFGVVFIEALYSGLPIVSSDFGGAAEIVTQGCGILTRPGDASEVARALTSLLDDASRRREQSVAAPRRAAELCDPASQLEKLARILQRVQRNKSASSTHPHWVA